MLFFLCQGVASIRSPALAMIAAFIIEWASATTDSRREQFKKLAGASRLALIYFGALR